MSRGGAIVNIAGTTPVDDPEYRYKMPLVYGKIEGRGNGIKTVIPNITDVGLSLHRSPGEVNKFFGCELGAQTTYNADTDRAVVNGAHTDAVLQEMMKRYIQGFVLCPSCGLPETNYKIKSDTIWHSCAACGAKEMVDMRHKLCTYILAQDKKMKKEKKAKDKKNKKKGGGSDEEKKKGSDDEKKKKKKDKKKEKDHDKKDKKDKKKDKKDKKKKKHHSDEEDSHENNNVDSVGDGMDNLSVGSADNTNDAEMMLLAVKATKKYLADNPDASAEEISEVVINQQMASALKSHDKVHIFVRAAITSSFFKNGEVAKYSPVIEKLTNGNPIMERHLIAALEGLCQDKPKNFAVLLKQLYDEDVLEEDVILDWAGEGRNEYTLASVDEETRALLRGEAEPVVVWLQDADSDDDSD
jgi:translation initiation factor 5